MTPLTLSGTEALILYGYLGSIFCSPSVAGLQVTGWLNDKRGATLGILFLGFQIWTSNLHHFLLLRRRTGESG
jgi:hypothetical protein